MADHGDDDNVFEVDDEEPKSLPRQALDFLLENIDLNTLVPNESPIPPVLKTPVLLGHGELDEKVKCRLGRELADTLTTLGMDVEFTIYTGFGHWYKVPDQVDHIAAFLQDKMGENQLESGVGAGE